MRILLVNDYQEQVGGTEVYLETLAKRLKAAGHHVSFYFGSNDYEIAVSEQKKLLSYIKRIFNPKHLIGIKKTVAEFKPDIIHVQNIFNELTPAILLGTGSIPVVMTLHDYSIVQAVATPSLRNGRECRKQICPGCFNCVGFRGTIYEKIKRAFHSFLLSRINLFIAPSRFMKEAVESNSSYHVVQVYNGFELPKAVDFQSTSTAIFAGRLIPDKGINYLIDAVPRVTQALSNFKLYVAGDGKLKKQLLSRVDELGIEKQVYFLDRLNSKQLLKYYAKAAVVIVPSIWHENLPTVGIEALSLGKPMVGTKVGGIPELIKDGENGLLVSPYDSMELADAIIAVLSSRETLQSMSKKALEKSKEFTIQNHLKKIQDLYSSVLRQ